jgi:hypothetical protein
MLHENLHTQKKNKGTLLVTRKETGWDVNSEETRLSSFLVDRMHHKYR